MGFSFDDTIVAPATLPGTGAISVIRISGTSALALADSFVSFAHGNATSAKGNTVKFGTIRQEDGSILDEVLCCIYRAPHSYTGEDSVEVMCHASSYIVSTILELAVSSGARIAQPGEFTQRAFLAGKMDLSQAEAVADVIAARTSSAHKLAFKQLKGSISSELSSLRGQLLEMAALLELELDFSEEDVEFADRKKLDALLDRAVRHIDNLASSFKLGNAIKKGVPVAIAGAPNAGKSTLLNNILGEQRSIVSDIAGTTRDTVEECFNSEGILFRLIDTAGIREVSDFGPIRDGEKLDGNGHVDGSRNGERKRDGQAVIERLGIERSFNSIRNAEIVIVLIDAEEVLSSFPAANLQTCLPQNLPANSPIIQPTSDSPTHPELSQAGAPTSSKALNKNFTDSSPIGEACIPILKQIIKCADLTLQKIIFALNKCDLLEKQDNNFFVNTKNYIVSFIKGKCFDKFCSTVDSIEPDFIEISAKTGKGVENLMKIMTDYEKSVISGHSSENGIISNARHLEALLNARNCLQKVRDSLSLSLPSDLAAEDLRAALSSLSSITGEITTDEVLGEIFGKFCIGK